MRARLLLPPVVFASLAGLARPQPATACSCGSGLDVVAPEEGATDVPLDARVWLGVSADHAWFGAELVLLAADEPDAVGTRQATIATGLGDLLVVTPLEPLRASTDYEVWGCEDGDCRHRVLGFTTGTGSIDGVPTIPELLDQDHDRSGGVICPREKNVELRVAHEGLVVVEHDSRADLDLVDVDGLTSALVVTPDEVFELDEGGCQGGWPGGRRVEVRLGALDLAGNFSGFGETEILDIGCGCRSDRPSPAGLLALSLVVLVGAARSRSR